MLRDSRLYRFFVVVADELSFTAAAARLRVAQPWLSTRIRHLEADLGLELFNRTTRTVELTDAGRRLLPKARTVIAAAEDFELTARTLAGRAPTLRIGAPPYLAYVAEGRELMAGFERAYPNVRVEMDVGWSEWLLGKLLSGDLDAAFLMGSERLDVLEEIPIAEVPLDIEFPDDDPLAAKPDFTPADLAGRAVVMFTRSFNPHAFDQITRILLANGGDIHERKAMWSTGVQTAPGPAALAVRMGWAVDRRRSGHQRRRLDFIAPLPVKIARMSDKTTPGMDDLMRMAGDIARQRKVRSR